MRVENSSSTSPWGFTTFRARGSRIEATDQREQDPQLVGIGNTPGAALMDLTSKLTQRINSRERAAQ